MATFFRIDQVGVNDKTIAGVPSESSFRNLTSKPANSANATIWPEVLRIIDHPKKSEKKAASVEGPQAVITNMPCGWSVFLQLTKNLNSCGSDK